MTGYEEFLADKAVMAGLAGIEVPVEAIHPVLFPFQRDIVRWALLKGRAALFEECGLGKTLQQLEWACHICKHTGGKVLILAPLAVTHQTVREAEKLGLTIEYVRSQEQADASPCSILVTNYDMMEHFEPDKFVGVVLDESSILKAFTGKTKRKLIEMFGETPYRLCCTATPAPNDHLEFGNHAEFLGVMESNHMISRWFVNDSMQAGRYRLKGHAEADFWRWMVSWAVCISKPSDLGPEYSDEGFIIPDVDVHESLVRVDHREAWASGQLLRMESLSATTMWEEKRKTAEARCDRARELVNGSDDAWILWCDTNYEADLLKERFPEAIEVRGSDGVDYKEDAVRWFCGELHICQLTDKYGRGKLAAWQKENRATGKNTTESTANSGLQSPASTNDNTQRNDECITPPITRLIRNGLENRRESIESAPKTSATQNGESDTLRTPNTESCSSKGLKIGHTTTHQKLSPKTCECSDLLLENTPQCWPLRAASVLSVARELATAGNNDSTLIMTTEPARSGDSSAVPATLDLESSAMIQDSSKRPQRTCECTNNPRILISKPDILGWGLNFQHCHNMIFVGVSYSFEKTYQALRRSWRYGQPEAVQAHMIYAETEGNIISTLERKKEAHHMMQEQMNLYQQESGLEGIRAKRAADLTTVEAVVKTDTWTAYLGDCITTMAEIPDNSVDFTIFSPPFSTLYIYSDQPADMGNNPDHDAFFEHFAYLIPELWRVTKPGRLCAVHCKDLPLYMNRDGAAGLFDFPGYLIRAFEHDRYGTDNARWAYHSRVTIWKDPVIEMQRTKNHGLLWKNFTDRGEVTRQGMADYVIIFRKWVDLDQMPDKQVHNEPKQGAYIGEEGPTSWDSQRDWSIQVWQKYASPVWFDIRQTNVLNIKQARDDRDEKHICPLQLDVIERCLDIWTNEGDLVLDPFAGIGSAGYMALKGHRRFVGIELKESYWNIMLNNLKEAEQEAQMVTLFDWAATEGA